MRSVHFFSLALIKPKLLQTDSKSPVMWYITLQHSAFPECFSSAITEESVGWFMWWGAKEMGAFKIAS